MHGYLGLSSSTQATGWLSSDSGTTTHRFRCDKDIEGVFAFSSASCLEVCTEVFQDDITVGQEAVRVSVWWRVDDRDGNPGQVWVSPAVGWEQLVGSGLGPPVDLS